MCQRKATNRVVHMLRASTRVGYDDLPKKETTVSGHVDPPGSHASREVAFAEFGGKQSADCDILRLEPYLR